MTTGGGIGAGEAAWRRAQKALLLGVLQPCALPPRLGCLPCPCSTLSCTHCLHACRLAACRAAAADWQSSSHLGPVFTSALLGPMIERLMLEVLHGPLAARPGACDRPGCSNALPPVGGMDEAHSSERFSDQAVRCSDCGAVWYCSEECMQADHEHQKECVYLFRPALRRMNAQRGGQSLLLRGGVFPT